MKNKDKQRSSSSDIASVLGSFGTRQWYSDVDRLASEHSYPEDLRSINGRINNSGIKPNLDQYDHGLGGVAGRRTL